MNELLGQHTPKSVSKRKKMEGREVMALGQGLLSLWRGQGNPKL